MCAQVSDALQYMHSKRFVHMDLATRNILVGAGTLIKVADFGLSRKYNKKKDYYKLSGKMVLPMLWTCPENFPPIVTRGVYCRIHVCHVSDGLSQKGHCTRRIRRTMSL